MFGYKSNILVRLLGIKRISLNRQTKSVKTIIRYVIMEGYVGMMTGIGLFPKAPKQSVQILEMIYEEGFYDTYFSETTDNVSVPSNVKENLGTIYEEMLLKRNREFDGLNNESNKRNYGRRIWGERYKKEEVNIIDNASEDDFNSYKGKAISENKLSNQGFGNENDGDLYEKIDLDLDVGANIKEMQCLQEFFIIHERVDFRELLINCFKDEENIHMEAKHELIRLGHEYKSKIKTILSDFLYYKENNLLPEQYKDTLF